MSRDPESVSIRRFRQWVAEALDSVPRVWGDRLDNVVVLVEEEPSAKDLLEVGMDPDDPEDELLGLYQGIPVGERGVEYAGLPDRIVIYRGPICRLGRDREEVIELVRETVLHELGHHFGLDEDDMPY